MPLTTDTRAAKTWLPAPEEHREYRPRGQRWTPYPHTRAHSTGQRAPTAPRRRAAGRGRAHGLGRPSQRGCHGPRGGSTYCPHAHTNAGPRNRRTSSPTHAPPRPQHVHQPREICTPPPALMHSDTTMAEPAAQRKTRPRSPTLDAAHEVIRALGLRGGEGDPPQEDGGTDSDLEEIPEPSTGSTPAEPAQPAGSVPTLCPAWKRGHCTGEG